MALAQEHNERRSAHGYSNNAKPHPGNGRARRSDGAAPKANPKYKRHSREPWGRGDVQTLRQLARQNTPTRVIGLKLGRTETAVRGKAQREGISLKPINRSPNKGRRRR